MNEKELKYTSQQIEQVLNLLNTLPFKGFEDAMKLNKIFQILNSPFVNKSNQNNNINIEDK